MKKRNTLLLALCLGQFSAIAFSEEKLMTEATAKKKALDIYPGKVLEVEQEKHKGEEAYSIEIKGNEGVREIIIRKSDGKMLENKIDKEDEDKNEDKNEK